MYILYWPTLEFVILRSVQQKGILRAHACIYWTTIAWAHQIWWREIANPRKVSVFLKPISLMLWIPYFPSKNALQDKNRTLSTRVFCCRFFSSRFSWRFKDWRLNGKNHCSCINLILTGKPIYFSGLIFKLMFFLIKEEMHWSNVQLLKESEKNYYARFIY